MDHQAHMWFHRLMEYDNHMRQAVPLIFTTLKVFAKKSYQSPAELHCIVRWVRWRIRLAGPNMNLLPPRVARCLVLHPVKLFHWRCWLHMHLTKWAEWPIDTNAVWTKRWQWAVWNGCSFAAASYHKWGLTFLVRGPHVLVERAKPMEYSLTRFTQSFCKCISLSLFLTGFENQLSIFWGKSFF